MARRYTPLMAARGKIESKLETVLGRHKRWMNNLARAKSEKTRKSCLIRAMKALEEAGAWAEQKRLQIEAIEPED